MSQPFTHPVVVIRPALPMDKADVLEFTKFIWEGEDYIKYVWDYWLADPNGGLFVAEFAGHAIGMGKLTKLSHGNWWMQGLRVDLRHQDKRIGSRLNDYFIQHWLEHGEGMVRFLTSSDKVKVHSMAERNGFLRVGDRGKFSISTVGKPLDGNPFVPILETEISEAVQISRRSELVQLSLGLVDLGWKYSEVDADAFHAIMNDDECFAYWWRGRQGVLLGWEDMAHDGSDERYYALSLVACDISMADELFEDVRRLGDENGQTSIRWYAFLNPHLQEILTAIGFEGIHQHLNYLYEKRHPTQP